MIQLTNKCPNFCNSCLTSGTKKNIRGIIISANNGASGTMIMLCKNCREQLINKLTISNQ